MTGQWQFDDGIMVPDMRIQPPTCGLQNRCITAVLIRLNQGAFLF